MSAMHGNCHPGIRAKRNRLVIAGLDPAIHTDRPRALNFIMDARAGKLAQPA
jgi:hypothetical protein